MNRSIACVLFLAAAWWFPCSSIARGTAQLESPAINNVVKTIQSSTRTIEKNTAPTLLQSTDTDEFINLTLSIIAALGTVLTAVAVRLEFKQRAINKEIQRRVLFDLIRHLYRNKVCVCATTWRLTVEGFTRFYPSEEHLLKLKVLPEDLRFDRFNNTPQYYDILHSLELKFRNYNTEIDVALDHLKESEISDTIKNRDLAVLSMKSDYLTTEIIQLIVITEGRLKNNPETSLLISRLIKSVVDGSPSSIIKSTYSRETMVYDKIAPKALKSINLLIAQVDNLITKTSAEYSGEALSIPHKDDAPARKMFFYDKRAAVKEILDSDIVREYEKISLVPFNSRNGLVRRRHPRSR